jgi:putative two-component system response regulator
MGLARPLNWLAAVQSANPPRNEAGLPRPVILVVDDERGPRESLRMILRPTFEVRVARDGLEALEILRNDRLRGEELMRTIRRDHPEVAVVVITGFGCLDSATEALRAGVSDYLQKPFDVVQVNAAIARALSRRSGRRRLARFLDDLGHMVGHHEPLQEVLDRAASDAPLGRDVARLLGGMAAAVESEEEPSPRTLAFLEVLAATVESQCGFLRGHARRTGFYAGLLADRLCLSAREQEEVRIAGFLHDIGKIGVPTDLLTRPGALTPKERAQVEAHPTIGARLVEPLGVAGEIVGAIRHHHEWWDGRGYGDGLFGDQIPLAARIVALADAYDAMTCDRPYRKALPPRVVRHEIERYAGVQFDPHLTKEFLLVLDTGDLDLQLLAEAATGEAPAGPGAPDHEAGYAPSSAEGGRA